MKLLLYLHSAMRRSAREPADICWKKEIAYFSELSFRCACAQCADPCEPLLWIGMVHYYHYQYYSHNYYYHIAIIFVIIITIIIFIVLHMLT